MNSENSPLWISEIVQSETIILNLQATVREELLAELVAQIPELQNHSDAQKTLLKALLDREQLCSTGVGDGVAFPHCRNALVGLVSKPVIVFGRHPSGVSYGSVDGCPAQLFFLVVAPTVSLHLQIMARLGRLLVDARVRKGLLLADQTEKVLQILQQAEKR